MDAWTSPNYIPFLGITAHWIDSQWELKSILIDFVKLSGPHSGENLSEAFMTVLREFGVMTKVALKDLVI